ncbi:L-serine ammonia-lyase, iron-sulfur-dependent, subunit alpha [Streptomyces sp. CA-251251]|uniref:L-serine ammonia-lyase, iron-sulfur-dependent, subunit alpha n=1 Tax=Streptomyces sp. CA-251251 TaxID=3240063 RepID=UPI003D946AF4
MAGGGRRAAGAFAEVPGGRAGQVENAAEVGSGHTLGLTRDPGGGLVPISGRRG